LIVTVLYYVFEGDPNLSNFVKNWGQKTSKFWQFGDLITNISGMQQDAVRQKTALQSVITTTHVYLI